jgi:hypothetical protein
LVRHSSSVREGLGGCACRGPGAGVGVGVSENRAGSSGKQGRDQGRSSDSG